MAKYSVWSIDAWANEEDGWDCNNEYWVADVELPSPTSMNLTVAEVVYTLYEREIITTNDLTEFELEDYDYEPLVMILESATTHEPLYEIRFEEE